MVLPFPKSKEQQEEVISMVKDVFDRRTEAKNIMRNVLLNVTPVHDYSDDNMFMTLT